MRKEINFSYDHISLQFEESQKIQPKRDEMLLNVRSWCRNVETNFTLYWNDTVVDEPNVNDLGPFVVEVDNCEDMQN